jgi:hypothetical protein
MTTIKLLFLTLFKASIIIAMILLFFGFKNIESRMTAAQTIHKQTYDAIYTSDQYQKLPATARQGLESMKVKLYFITKVDARYSNLLAAFTVITSLAIAISILFDFLNMRRTKSA